MAARLLGIIKLFAVVSLVILLKSCSSGAGLSGSSGKSGKSNNKGGQNGQSEKSNHHDVGGKGGAPGDADLNNNGRGDLNKNGESADSKRGGQQSPGPGNNPGSGEKNQPKGNEELIMFDPQFKNLSNEQFQVSAETTKKPLDLVIAVDTSGSMGEEALKVQQNVSILTQAFGKEKGLDYHIWIIAENVVPAGVDPAKVSIVAQEVGSNDALAILTNFITGAIPLPKMIRQETQKAFVVVTDDNAQNVTSAAFINTVQADARFKGKTSFNGLTWIEGTSKVSDTCAGEASGTEYINLAKAKETSGTVYDLCANDWNPLFVDLGKRLIQQSVILEYKLKVAADPKGPFAVGVNGVKADASTFRFDEAKNAIVFADGKAPPVGAAVVVAFKPK